MKSLLLNKALDSSVILLVIADSGWQSYVTTGNVSIGYGAVCGVFLCLLALTLYFDR